MSLPRIDVWSTPEEAATIINSLALSSHANFYSMGMHLIKIQETLGYGKYESWFAANVRAFSIRTGYDYMAYAKEHIDKGATDLLPYFEKSEPAGSTSAESAELAPDADPDSPGPAANPDAPDATADPEHPASAKIPNNEFYTPAIYIDASRQVLGGQIDVDPASTPERNKTVVKATTIYSKDDSGLDHDWHGRIFCNPPYVRASRVDESLPRRFGEKGLAEYRSGRMKEGIFLFSTMVLCPKWFQALAAVGDLCILNHKIEWEGPDAEKDKGPWGSVFIYFGPHRSRFASVFSAFGTIVVPERPLSPDELREFEETSLVFGPSVVLNVLDRVEFESVPDPPPADPEAAP